MSSIKSHISPTFILTCGLKKPNQAGVQLPKVCSNLSLQLLPNSFVSTTLRIAYLNRTLSFCYSSWSCYSPMICFPFHYFYISLLQRSKGAVEAPSFQLLAAGQAWMIDGGRAFFLWKLSNFLFHTQAWHKIYYHSDFLVVICSTMKRWHGLYQGSNRKRKLLEKSPPNIMFTNPQ